MSPYRESPLASAPFVMRNHALLLTSILISGAALATQTALPTGQIPPGNRATSTVFCPDFVNDFANPGNCIQTSTLPTMGMLLPLGPEFFVSATGEVGIGTTTPISRLGVNGGVLPGILASTDSISASAVTGWATQTIGSAAFGLYGESDGDAGTGVLGWAADLTGGYTYGVLGQADSTAGTGVLGWATATTGATSGVRGVSDATSGAGIDGYATETTGSNYGVYGETASAAGYGVFSTGDMGATGTKSFVQPHPVDPALEIRFVCLEGNESGTYFRGSGQLVNGQAVIEVPESFALVSEPDSLTVQLTASGGRAQLWTESESLSTISVRGDADVRFHYFVNGVRRGFADFEPIRANRSFVPTTLGVPFGTQYPEGLRQVLIENGTLRSDGTPNEATALREGWQLLEPEAASRETRPTRQAPEPQGH